MKSGGCPIPLPISFRSEIIAKCPDQIDGLVIVGGDAKSKQNHQDKKQPRQKVLVNVKSRLGRILGRKEILAVRWHPERELRHPETRRLFKAFVEMCR